MSAKEFVVRGRSFAVTTSLYKMFKPFIRVATDKGYIAFSQNQFSWDRNPDLLDCLLKLLDGGEVPFHDKERRILLQEAHFYKLKDCVKKIKEEMDERDRLVNTYSDHVAVLFHIGDSKTSTFALPKENLISKPTRFQEIFYNQIKDSSNTLFIRHRNTHVQLIIDFLLKGVLRLPNRLEEVEEIKVDAEFFMIESLVKICVRKIVAITSGSDEETRKTMELQKNQEEQEKQRKAKEDEQAAKVAKEQEMAKKKKEEEDRKKAEDERKKIEEQKKLREAEDRKKAERAEQEVRERKERERVKEEERKKAHEEMMKAEAEAKKKMEEDAKKAEEEKKKEERKKVERAEEEEREKKKREKEEKEKEEREKEERKRAEGVEKKKDEADARKKAEEKEKWAQILKNRRKAPIYLGRHVHDDTEIAESQKPLKEPVHLVSLEKDREQREKRKQDWTQNDMQKDAHQTVIFITENGKECRLSRRILFIQGSDTMTKFFGLPKDMDGRYKFGDKDTVFELLTTFMCQLDGFEPPKNVPLLRKLKNWANYFRMHLLEEMCLQKNPALRGETQIKKVGGMGVVKSREDVFISQLAGPLAVHDLNTSSMYTEKQPEVVLIVAPGEQAPTTTRRHLPRGATQHQGAAAGTSQVKPALKMTDQPAPLPPHGRYNLRRGRDPSVTEPPSKRNRVQSWHGV